jgi:hypothetical protein
MCNFLSFFRFIREKIIPAKTFFIQPDQFFQGYLHFNDFMLNIAPDYRKYSVTQPAGFLSSPTSPELNLIYFSTHF